MIKKYVERLLEEWKQHGKIIISLDFDDTIYCWRPDFNKEDVDRTIKVVQEACKTGAYVVMFTASNEERFPEILKYCSDIGIPVSSINKNPFPLPYGNNGKIYYNINLCDRSGLNEALEILETALYQYRGYLQTQKTATDVA